MPTGGATQQIVWAALFLLLFAKLQAGLCQSPSPSDDEDDHNWLQVVELLIHFVTGVAWIFSAGPEHVAERMIKALLFVVGVVVLAALMEACGCLKKRKRGIVEKSLSWVSGLARAETVHGEWMANAHKWK